MLGINYPVEVFETSMENIVRIFREAFVSRIILNHYLLRSLEWRKHLKNF
jgi:predicted metallo-beta-lactamase superfamily hydrolase